MAKEQETPSDDFPERNFPIVFADGVSSASHGSGLVKFYLFRMDPSLQGSGKANASVFGQIVMPSSGYAAMTIFFMKILKQMAASGEVSPQLIEEMKAEVGANGE